MTDPIPPDAPLRAEKAADRLAGVLRGRIRNGAWAEGARLPAERELAEEMGLSRASVREALQRLATEGLIETRPGRGGSVVRRPGPDGLAEALGRGTSPAAREAQAALETAMAGLAAENRTETDLAALAELHKGLAAGRDDGDRVRRLGHEWRRAVAASCHNALLTTMSAAIAEAADHAAPAAVHADEVLRAQARIMDAIARRDPDAAMRRMGQYLRARPR